jgi:hypothetical protein
MCQDSMTPPIFIVSFGSINVHSASNAIPKNKKQTINLYLSRPGQTTPTAGSHWGGPYK